MTADEADTNIDASERLMKTALSLAEQTPDMMQESIITIEQSLILLYEDAAMRNDEKAMRLFDTIWDEIQKINNLATSQALGVASAGIAAMAYRIQRDEAQHNLAQVSEAYQQIAGLMKGGAA